MCPRPHQEKLLIEQLNELTADHLKMLEEESSHWRDVGLSIAETDRHNALFGFKLAYRAAGLSLPKIIIWLKSPRAGATAARLLRSDLEWPQSLDGSQKAVWDDVWTQSVSQIKPLIGANAWKELRLRLKKEAEQRTLEKYGRLIEKNVKDEFAERMGIWVWKYLRRNVGDSTFQQVRTNVEQVVEAQVRKQVRPEVWEEMFHEFIPPVRQQVFASIGEPLRADDYSEQWGASRSTDMGMWFWSFRF